MEPFPNFPYHPDPVATGAVERSEAVCRCCGRARGFIYVGPAYGEEDLDDCLCPWCIESGEAASMFDASFVDDNALHSAGLDPSVIDQVSLRTPGYNSLQPEEWRRIAAMRAPITERH